MSFDEYVRQNVAESIRDRIDFRGQLSNSDVMALRARHFLTIIAARYDIQGYMMMEALSLGCPIVTTGVCGIPEVIKDRRNGLISSSVDANGLASACKSLLDDPTLAEQLGRQARIDCKELYSPVRIAENMIVAYHAAIDRAKFRFRRRSRGG